MRFSGLAKRGIGVVNGAVTAVLESPRFGGLVDGHITSISYVGRRSGRSFRLPVGYRRAGDDVTIAVGMPDAKTWWRNFLGAGAPLTIRLDGADRRGHAVARRDEKGRVSVTVQLAEQDG